MGGSETCWFRVSQQETMLSIAFRRLAKPSAVLAVAAASTFSSSARCQQTSKELLSEARKRSNREAHLLYKQAAELGDLDAIYRLGQNYLHGMGTTKDPVRAAELFENSASQGHAQSMYALAVLYRLGKGVERDSKKANDLVKKAAEAGCMEALAAMQSTNLHADAKADFGRGRLQQSLSRN